MGNCMGTNNRAKPTQFWKGDCASLFAHHYPDLDQSPKANEDVTLKLEFSSLKCIMQNKGVYFLGVILDREEFRTSPFPRARVSYWDSRFTYDVTFKIRELPEKMVRINVYKGDPKKPKIIGYVNIDLLTIAYGPIHHDLPIVSRKGELLDSRIALNIDCQQISMMRIYPKKITLELNNKVQGGISVSIRSRHEDLKISSDPSEEIGGLGHSVDMHFVTPDMTDEQVAAAKEELLLPPILEYEVMSKDIHTNSIQVCFWVNPENSLTPRQSKQDGLDFVNAEKEPTIELVNKEDPESALKLLGEFWLSFSKLFRQEIRDFFRAESSVFELLRHGNGNNSLKGQADIRNILFEKPRRNREKEVDETLWHAGQNIGKISGSLVLVNTPHVKQMLCGVHTENGIQKTSTVFVPPKSSRLLNRKSLPVEIVNLSSLKDQLLDGVFTKSLNKNSSRKLSDIDNEDTLGNISEILTTSHKESMVAFVYASKSDQIKAQNILLDLGEHLSDYMDAINYELRPLYYKNLRYLLGRGELDIGFMALDEGNESEQIKTDQLSVAKRYRDFLVDMLSQSLKRMEYKGIEMFQKELIENFLAIAFFRLPRFREQLLRILVLPDGAFDPEDLEKSEWLLRDKFDVYATDNPVLHLFDWKTSYHTPLEEHLTEKSMPKALEHILHQDKWKKRFEKRGTAFFLFFHEWIEHIYSTIVLREHILWRDIPGYNIMTKAFLYEMKTRPITQFPDALQWTSKALLNNELMISVFIKILFRRTNVHDHAEVAALMELLQTWFQTMDDYGKCLPPNFDDHFFITGLSIILENDYSLNTAKVLWFLYHNLHLFQGDTLRRLLVNTVCKKYWMFLAFHWCWIVRSFFFHLLFYKIDFRFSKVSITSAGSDGVRRARRKSSLVEGSIPDVGSSTKMLSTDEINVMIYMEVASQFSIMSGFFERVHAGTNPDDIDPGDIPAEQIAFLNQRGYDFRYYIKAAMNDFEAVKTEYEKWKSQWGHRKGELTKDHYPDLQLDSELFENVENLTGDNEEW